MPYPGLSLPFGSRAASSSSQSRLMAGGVEFDIPEAVKAEFARSVECRREVKGLRYEREPIYRIEEELAPA